MSSQRIEKRLLGDRCLPLKVSWLLHRLSRLDNSRCHRVIIFIVAEEYALQPIGENSTLLFVVLFAVLCHDHITRMGQFYLTVSGRPKATAAPCTFACILAAMVDTGCGTEFSEVDGSLGFFLVVDNVHRRHAAFAQIDLCEGAAVVHFARVFQVSRGGRCQNLGRELFGIVFGPVAKE